MMEGMIMMIGASCICTSLSLGTPLSRRILMRVTGLCVLNGGSVI